MTRSKPDVQDNPCKEPEATGDITRELAYMTLALGDASDALCTLIERVQNVVDLDKFASHNPNDPAVANEANASTAIGRTLQELRLAHVVKIANTIKRLSGSLDI